MRELDINPLVADERGVVAVDVRVALHTPPRALARYDHLAIAPYPSEFSADGKVGEFALVVADAWQGRGVGSALMHALADCARAQGMQRLHGEVLAVNSRMLELMRFLGFNMRPDASDPALTKVVLELQPA